MFHQTGRIVYKTARRIVISVVGGTVLIIGVIMLLTPGPGILGIAAGLGILGLEFAWAKRWLSEVRKRSSRAIHDISDDNSRIGRFWRRGRQFFIRIGQRVRGGFRHGRRIDGDSPGDSCEQSGEQAGKQPGEQSCNRHDSP